MKTKVKFIGFVVFLLLQACDKNDDVEYLETKAFVKEIEMPDSVIMNEPFSIDMIIYGSSGCSDFSRFETNNSSDTIHFMIYQKRDKNLLCTTQIIDIDVSITTKFNAPGMNYVKFDGENGKVLIDSIFVKK